MILRNSDFSVLTVIDFQVISGIPYISVLHFFNCKMGVILFFNQVNDTVSYCLSHMQPPCRHKHMILKLETGNSVQCFCDLFVPDWFSGAKVI